ncbi:carbohydrate ABC transporter permease [Actinoallomurus rhizosphaericola]|uniref:carbohydrate ABC transporter permease n=1 Tax=Actinoallomurus rhizosphaericola TaxID=2952536 RepID=UPI0020911E55|nr:sugar ABC transporter permease [Actinoallomurus rhizosphaericola]MCO5992279.1 sugar ABC transporter permease [Actinoallomurus rhizosphaericola]
MAVDLRPATAAPRAAPHERRGFRARLARMDVKYSPYLYISPFYLLFLVFGLFPLGYTFWVSLNRWEIIGDHKFIGLRNYTRLMTDDQFWNAVVNTLGMFVIATVPQLILALLLANALNRRLRFQTLFRMGVLLPLVTSVAAVAIVFTQLYGRDYGMVNWILHFFGVHKIDWQANRWGSWVAISTMVDWRWTGYNSLIFLAGMQAIPRDLYEAAAIDGASRRQQFWRITVPMLRPTIIFTSIISTIGGLQLFTEPLLFNFGYMNGGSLRQSQTVAMYMFENAFNRFQYGYGSAVAWMLFLLILVFSLVNFLLIRRFAGGEDK